MKQSDICFSLQSEDEKDPNCDSNCDTDSNEMPDEYLPLNKRFWLVTSVLGQLNDEDIPLLQERLADIYRIAFTRFAKKKEKDTQIQTLFTLHIFCCVVRTFDIIK